MDLDLLRDEEDFPTFDSDDYLEQYSDELTNLRDIQNFDQNEYEWGLEGEREINGDIALIPVCDMSLTKFDESPPIVDDFHKIMNDWQQFINVDPSTELAIDDPIIEPECDISNQKLDPLDSHTLNFDITKYLSESENFLSDVHTNIQKAGVKKIDLNAQKYIIDEEDDVDVETISESESSPILEARDLNSLLEQFEATQLPELLNNFLENDTPIIEEQKSDSNNAKVCNIVQNIEKVLDDPVKIKLECKVLEVDENLLVKKEIDNDYEYGIGKRKECIDQKISASDKLDSKIDIIIKTASIKEPTTVDSKTASSQTVIKDEKPHTSKSKLSNPKITTPDISKSKSSHKPCQAENSSHKPCQAENSSHSPNPSNILNPSPESTTSFTPNKQILDSLPQELIARIRESGKRKPISVIAPIPAKKRGGPRMHETKPSKIKVIKSVSVESIQLDHDYCSPSVGVETYPKNPKKDSGFESAEEDDRTIIGKQPTVKNADGKLMVSLLKVNTIHTPITNQQKKKLNFEEYKKRFLKTQNNSQNSSPISSTCSSPVPEDENTKLLKHQEKLMRMAQEVLNTPPKGEKKSEATMVITPPIPLQVPPDMEMKTLVSIGVNTDFKVHRKNLDPLDPVERLDEMKPLLQKVSAKINGNSLITSVIENIPKLIESCEHEQSEDKNSCKNKEEHGEDKTIVYLPKNRPAVKTKTVECQTNISLIQQTKASRYRRRRLSSDSSCSSESSRDSTSSRHNRDRSSNNSRCSSRSSKSSRSSVSTRSTSSYSSRSPSRSRSISPRYSRMDKERLREVEERRVIYVGRIPPRTTKEELKKRFLRFGAITNVSLHSRDHSYLDNYGFVTFVNKLDAYEAIEHGNDDPWQPKFDLSFGGRRIFCQTTYSDLDNMRDECGYFAQRNGKDDSFDKLLREVQEKLRKRKA